MAHSMTTGMLNATLAARLRPFIAVSLQVASSTLYIWSGYGSLSWNGQTWLGVGYFGGVSPIQEVNQVQASGVTLSLSGVPPELVEIALAEVRRYLPAKIWLGALDDTGAVIADPFQIRNGRVDTARITFDGKSAAINITVESRLIAMQNTRERRFTDQDQRSDFPQDDGFKFVDGLQQASISWGQGLN